jgi:GcrA cell cycle regulator
MQSADWTPEQSKALAEYLAKGMTYSAIRDAINAAFKTAYSRNATISRARRMGLAASVRPDRPKPPPPIAPPGLHRVREPVTFCGHPRRPGSSYCTAHFDLSIGPGTAAERAADRVLLKLIASYLRAPVASESIVPELAHCIAWPTA